MPDPQRQFARALAKKFSLNATSINQRVEDANKQTFNLIKQSHQMQANVKLSLFPSFQFAVGDGWRKKNKIKQTFALARMELNYELAALRVFLKFALLLYLCARLFVQCDNCREKCFPSPTPDKL